MVQAACGGIEVRTDTTKVSNVVITGFVDGRNLIAENVHQR